MNKQAIATACVLTFACAAHAEIVLWNNGPFVTHPGQGAGGADASMSGSDHGILGLNAGKLNGHFRRADDFHTSGATWAISAATVFVFSTFADPTDQPYTGIDLKIWAGPPEQGLLVASTTTFTVQFANAYRVTSGQGSLLQTTRPLFAVKALFAQPVILSPGTTYWIDFQLLSASGHSAFTPTVQAHNPTNPYGPFTRRGNHRFFNSSQQWVEHNTDVTGQGIGTEIPFLVHGMPHQPCPADLNFDGVVDVDDLLQLLATWGECVADECAVPFSCGQPIPWCDASETCFCVETYDGLMLCKQPAACTGIACADGMCPPGFVCIVNTCCGATTCSPIETFDCPESAEEVAAAQRARVAGSSEISLE